MLRYFCCDRRRRAAVEASPLNGIDYIEVLDNDAPSEGDRQLILLLYLIKPLGAVSLEAENFSIAGGDRIRDIQVTAVTTFADSRVVRLRLNQWGDYSTYTLQIIGNEGEPGWLDPILAAINFSFKVDCPSDFDCKPERICPPEPTPPAVINYLAKDYASFRRLMLDRLAVLMPQGFERNPADVGIALVELLAYVGDHLSYQQDAIATEAYLGTARRRTSVRRHARLVDYFMHDGGNARVWVQVQVSANNVELPQSTPLLTRIDGQPLLIAPGSSVYEAALQQKPVIFETVTAATLFQAHNQLSFYTWGDQECCLPQGSTQATLRGHYPDLQAGDILIFAEAVGPRTGQPEDADLSHRWAVRLTAVTLMNDPIGGQFAEPPNDDIVNVTRIQWDRADALPFALCLSAQTDAAHGEAFVEQVSVALGNIVLADHGATIATEFLGVVPEPTLFRVPTTLGDRCQPPVPDPVMPRFQPQLSQRPLTQAEPYTAPPVSAQAAFQRQIGVALPAIILESDLSGQTASWSPVRDLLNSDRQDRNFVVETEADGSAFVRFGDDRYGLRPSPGSVFSATYRIGNGTQGNIGADTLAHAVSEQGAIVQVRNPLPAQGGREPESLEQVRQSAPYAFRVQQRAVTLADYAAAAERHPGVQKAAATFRWTGSWRTVFVTVDRLGGLSVDAAFETELRQHLEPFRMAGYDLEVDGPRYVSLEIDMLICVQPSYFRSEVKAALLQVLSSRALADGSRGLFHPDNFTFGQAVYLSQIYAIAQAVAGVASVQIQLFQRQGSPSSVALDTGVLEIERLEIARLANDPDFPEHGVLRLQMEGGK
ncbi:MAG: putative baseplate assembly protein [Leptolyngbya sp. SIO4C5]|nr:putative baseplate assembly protein [Leptolyngbya sp. SIO4C5]